MLHSCSCMHYISATFAHENNHYNVYVWVRSGESMLSPRIILKLLEEAKGIPVMFSILLPSGNVVMEVKMLAFVSILISVGI